MTLLPPAEYGLNFALISERHSLSRQAGRELTAAETRERSRNTAIDPYTPEKVWKWHP